MLGEGSIRVGLIGCGRIAPRHVQAVDATPELRLVAVCDRIIARADRIAAGTGAAVYASHLEMLERERLDLVAVLTESGTHARVGADAAARVPVVVVEKPMALTVEDADRLVASCDGSGSRLFVVKQNRFNPPIVRLREALDAGRFGNIVMGTVRMRWCRDQAYYDQDPWRGTRAMDGGVLANQACHYVDVLQWMLGPVTAVKGYTATRLARIEAPDTGVAILRAASGALGVIEATTATRPSDLEGSLALLGEGGSVAIGGFALNRVETWEFVRPVPGDAHAAASSVDPPNAYGFGHLAFYRDVVDCIRTGRRSMLEGAEGRKAVELIAAIHASALSGDEVRIR